MSLNLQMVAVAVTASYFLTCYMTEPKMVCVVAPRLFISSLQLIPISSKD